ncbi:MAG: DUF6252 family protein [Nonlabens sp.]
MKKAIFTLIFSLALIACNKNDDDDGSVDPISQLPPETSTGENTFGYLINGEPINITNTNGQVAIFQGGLLQIAGETDSSEVDTSIRIRIDDPIQVNTIYELTNIPESRALYNKRVNDVSCDYRFEDTYRGIIVFTRIDRVNYIISGTFEFSTTNENCGDVDITEGRFDLQYIP